MSILSVDDITDAAGTGSPTYSQGISIDAANLSNVDATLLGLKQYLHGVAYNAGIQPTVSSGDIASLVVVRAVFMPYKIQSAGWRMRFNIVTTSASDAGGTVNTNGVVFKNVAGYFQAVLLSNDGLATSTIAFAKPNTDGIEVNTGANLIDWNFSGDVELESKPTWAF